MDDAPPSSCPSPCLVPNGTQPPYQEPTKCQACELRSIWALGLTVFRARSASLCGCEYVSVCFVPITCWEQGENTTNPTPHSSSGAPAPGCMGTGWRGRASGGVGRAWGGDEVKVIDAAQPAVGESGDASVSPGAGRGVNEQRRHAHSALSAHPGMASAHGPLAPSSPEQVSHFPEA